MTDIMFTRTALTGAAEKAGVTTDQARTILEAAGVKVQPEKPALPTEPGSVIIATEVRGVTGVWRMFCDPNGDWFSADEIADHEYHAPEDITKWTEARVGPEGVLEALADAQDALEDLAKMGVMEADRGAVLEMAARLAAHGITHHDVDQMVKQHYSTAQHAAPAEGEQIDMKDVRAGDRVWMELDNGEQITFTVKSVGSALIESGYNHFPTSIIRSVRLLHREEA